MNFACLALLLIALSRDAAKKCDPYFVGTVWVRRHSIGVDGESQPVSYQGCKKGCFYNETFNEDGARMCEKCSAIKDENVCKGHEATCRWNKKCGSTSCPQIAKNRNTLETPGSNFIDDNSEIRTAEYQLKVRLKKECIEGSNLEKYFNQIYLDHYKKWTNYRYSTADVNNCDNCTVAAPNTHNCTQTECYNLNASLLLTNHQCDDRLYSNLEGTTQDTTCRELPETTRQTCYFNYDQRQSREVYRDTTNTTTRPGLQYERCIQEYSLERDPECTRDENGLCTRDEYGEEVHPVLSPENRRRIHGYSTVVEICNLNRSIAHKTCEDNYKANIKACDNSGVDEINPNSLVRERVDVKASRAACHHLYHCMYSKINNRCSYWSIWAFILTLVVVVVVVVGAGVAAAVFFLTRK